VTRDDDVVRASEIGQYAYCARAWWYARVKGYRPENQAALRRGTARHRHHGRRVAGYDLLRRLALLLLLLAAAAVIAWLLLGGG
jgi:CRISPR/Cas system-associated exonuclease Cas4 (RecB family)